ncbi:hypothetical protein GGX14DRAFT_393116 [Mycena pura]|uniref:Uncharacterized protein n=1 Tax=Mycena pura TaxID=153505 RepID=A0AAD6YF96_9AGAR|nr:hypothetical protein GGX14DRAFT_393116 [Mycena pura]
MRPPPEIHARLWARTRYCRIEAPRFLWIPDYTSRANSISLIPWMLATCSIRTKHVADGPGYTASRRVGQRTIKRIDLAKREAISGEGPGVGPGRGLTGSWDCLVPGSDHQLVGRHMESPGDRRISSRTCQSHRRHHPRAGAMRWIRARRPVPKFGCSDHVHERDWALFYMTCCDRQRSLQAAVLHPSSIRTHTPTTGNNALRHGQQRPATRRATRGRATRARDTGTKGS